MTGQVTQPNREELKNAFQAGFDSIDAGDNFYTGFQAYLQGHGYRLAEQLDCTCSDRGRHGHQPECRWVKA